MDLDNLKQGLKKTTIQKVTYHHFLKYNDINHLLLIIDSTIIRLINLANYQFKITIEYKINHIEPIDVALQANCNIYLLCKHNIYWIGFNEIVNKRQPKRYDGLIGNDVPKRLICLTQSQWVIVYDLAMSFISQGEILKIINYPQNMNFTRCIIDHEFDNKADPFVVVPHQHEKFPYVFSLRQAYKWKQDTYLDNYMKLCDNYYSEDEKVTSCNYIIAFSSLKKLLCLCFTNDFLILQCKTKQLEKVDFFLKMKIKINMGWKEVPYYCSIENSASLSLIYADHEKVGCIKPFDYVHLRRKIKQNQNNPINQTYSTSQGYSLLISTNQQTKKLKLYLAKF